ncbi:GH25 family lysozyme [Jiangella gansuensis]|uniref:GH25 family lysozyme n=1 Tax=Jiangella gansuensis TaxID=281473 RepID=UPI00047EA014|nr:GH25 family lysozyme [Jiangella gansuensis]
MRRRRRVIVGLLAALGVLAVAAAVFWFVFVPHWRPGLDDGERFGIDVSAHQDRIDWDLVAGDDIEFAYIKASEGQGWVDDWFVANWDGAARAGIERGAYHFFTLCAPGEAQARNFLRVAPPDDDALPPAIDLELSGNCSERPPADEVAHQVQAFVDLVEEAWGRDLLFYVRPDWESLYPVRDGLDRDLWDFRFLRRPTDERWRVWQVNIFADVDGIDGDVDLDVMRPG